MGGRRKQYQVRYHPKRLVKTVGDKLVNRTPRKPKLKSNPSLGRPTIHPYTNPLIEGELENAVETKQDPEALVLRVFPNDKLPCSPGSMLSYMKTNINHQSLQYAEIVVNGVGTGKSRWSFLPRMTDSSYAPGVKEEDFASFITGIGNSCVSFPFKHLLDFTMERLFTGAFATRPLRHTDSGLERKPDILGADSALLLEILARLHDGDTFTWPNVRLIIEIRSTWEPSVFETKMHIDIANKVLAIFDQQPNRRFVPTLALAGYEACFSHWNRAGVVHSSNFNVNSCPELFLRIIMGFLYAKDVDIGFDPNMLIDEEGNYHILASGREFIFDTRLFSSQMIHGRGTWCWTVREVVPGADPMQCNWYVVKDSWPLESRWPDEVHHLEKIKRLGGIKGVVNMAFYEDVQIDEMPDTTDAVRGSFPKLHNRIHRRIFFEEEGEPIYMFRTKRELLKAFVDLLEAHYNLFFNAKILHGDISLYNLLLLKRRLRDLTAMMEDRSGLLADLDYAIDLEIERARRRGPRGVRTGTPPFMSYRILLDEDAEHTLHDDLESFFYVLVYLCAMYSGPNGQEIQGECPPFMHQWLYMTEFETLGYVKKAQLDLSISLWRKKVSKDFQPYWNCLKICILKLRRLVRRANATHEEFIQILKDTIKTMPLDDNSTVGDDDVSDSEDMIDDKKEIDEGYESPTPSTSSVLSRKRQLPAVDFIHTSSRSKHMRLVRSMEYEDVLVAKRRKEMNDILSR